MMHTVIFYNCLCCLCESLTWCRGFDDTSREVRVVLCKNCDIFGTWNWRPGT